MLGKCWRTEKNRENSNEVDKYNNDSAATEMLLEILKTAAKDHKLWREYTHRVAMN